MSFSFRSAKGRAREIEGDFELNETFSSSSSPAGLRLGPKRRGPIADSTGFAAGNWAVRREFTDMSTVQPE